jgi:HK97 family phage prohead protease
MVMGKSFPNDVTRDIPPLHLRAAVRPGSIDAEKRTAEVVWTTGAAVLRGFFDKFWEELSLDPAHVRMQRLNNGAPLLDSHDGYSGASAVLGVVESARLEKGQGTAVVRFAKAEDDPNADAVFRKVKDGILQNVSVGYRTFKMEKVAGGDTEIPTYRAIDWEPYEISVVPMGADDGAGFRGSDARDPNPCIFAASLSKETRTMPDPIITTEKPAATAPPALSVEESTRAAADARAAEAAAAAAASVRSTETALRAEREREVEIRSLVRKAKLGDELADKLIREGAQLADVRAAVLKHLTDGERTIDNHGFIAGEDRRDKFIRGGVSAIVQRYGHSSLIASAKKVERFAHHFRDLDLGSNEFGGMKVYDLARAALEMAGQSTRSLHGDALVKRALNYRGDAGMNTTSDFAVLLETAVNKLFLGRYATTDVTWRRWCAVKAVQDFRTSTFYRPGSFSVLDTVTESGEVKHKNIPDGAKATLTPFTKGNIVGISRRSIVNDDMGIFRDMATGLGEAAAYSIETDAFALITANSGTGALAPDGTVLFHTNHGNIGATGAMSVATIDSARAKIKLQKDASGVMYLNAVPRIWLGPVELGGQARQNNAAQYDPSKSTFVPNIVNGLFTDVIDVGQLSASSATRHYLLADPSQFPVFAVGFIDGQEAPRIETDNSFEYDGVQMRVLLDYGTAVIDYRGAATCAGA